MTPLAPHLTAYLRERLPQERQASKHTVDAYAYTFKLLFAFTTKRLGVPPSALTLEQLDAPLLVEFLAHLQAERGNSARTRNARLVALKSFMRFIEYRVPSAVDQVRRVLAIPRQRTDVMLVGHVDADEAKALLDAPDPTTRLGIRDRALLLMGFAGGLRVSEIVGLRLDDLSFDGAYLWSFAYAARDAGNADSCSGGRLLTLSAPGSPCAGTPSCPRCSSTRVAVPSHGGAARTSWKSTLGQRLRRARPSRSAGCRRT